jgi:hypothetical protein
MIPQKTEVRSLEIEEEREQVPLGLALRRQAMLRGQYEGASGKMRP